MKKRKAIKIAKKWMDRAAEPDMDLGTMVLAAGLINELEYKDRKKMRNKRCKCCNGTFVIKGRDIVDAIGKESFLIPKTNWTYLQPISGVTKD